jgi:glycerol-3-phosphate acyltransferase PlsY
MIVATVFIVISFALIGYLFGSILFGVIVARISKTNLRATGSQNVGGTNVSRTLGKKFGILVSVLDSTKSYLTVVVCWIIFRYSIFEWFIDSEKLYPLIYIGGIFAVIGHC